ncbi:MBL fold metallo-hydrolase [Noviherbaspirillum saxi]|uniref:MBL fold metallo-hydrolase n=1 Tax=Noviherbaspirillum saxi TaxID=2320863 RepID=A0A3A3FGD1_9BURK|nr:MBL fold metallo-hydrolase [Noviherbaspirillum saxi]RJF92240.1 MBL fold metallo-hydrolase [Noviherbaspirillum saxi]
MSFIKTLAASLLVLIHFSAVAAQEKISADLRVHLLGTGSPLPATLRFGPSILVEAGQQKFIFDAGRGPIQRLHTLGIPFAEADKLFLTHLHSDHTIGIPDLYLTGWLRGRKVPLKVWGPAGTRHMMEHMVKSFDYDIKIRLDQNAGSKVETTEFTEGVVYQKDDVTITAFEVDHGPVKPAFGFRIDYKGRSVILSGDTRYSESLVKHAKGVDLLVHEVAAGSDELMRTSPMVRNVVGIHTEPEMAGKVFLETAPRMAVYSHIVLFGVSEAQLEQRTRKTYAGPLTIGEDLMTFEIGEQIKVSTTKASE